MMPKFLQPEVWPYASVEIVRDTTTHYLPVFTRNGPGGTQLAFCNIWIDPARHSAEPSCADCQKLLQQDAKDIADLQAGIIDVGPPVSHVDFDPTGGHPRK